MAQIQGVGKEAACGGKRLNIPLDNSRYNEYYLFAKAGG
jgi:hypothetical protein